MSGFLAKGAQNRRPATTEDRREALVEILLTMLVVKKSGGGPNLIGARDWLLGREKVISRPKRVNSAAVRNDRREVNGRENHRDRGDGPGDLLQ